VVSATDGFVKTTTISVITTLVGACGGGEPGDVIWLATLALVKKSQPVGLPAVE